MSLFSKDKTKSVAISKYFEIIKPQYVYYKIIPNKSIRNYNSTKIATAVTSMYRSFCQRITVENKKLFFTAKSKVLYFTYLHNNVVEFYFMFPVQFEPLFKDKISEVWKGVTCEKVLSIPTFSNDCVQYFLDYKKDDAFSIATDKRNNFLLGALTNTLSVMEEGDKLGIIYNFMPTEQLGWKAHYNEAIEKFKKGLPVDKNFGSQFVMKWAITIIASIGDFLIETLTSFFGGTNKPSVDKEEVVLAPETIKKKCNLIVDTQIIVLSESNDNNRAIQNALSATQSFDVLSSDNEFKSYRVNIGGIDYEKYKYNKVSSFKASTLECQNFISLPGKEIIDEHHLSCIDVLETEVPKELQSGIIRIGNSTFRGTDTPTYLCNDFELRNLPLCITGSNRSGKSTYMENITYDCLQNGECVIAFDFCGNCEFSDKLSNTFSDRVISVDCSDFNNLQGLGYNEIKHSEDTFIQYRNAKMQSIQLSTLLNSVNDDDKTLKAKMDRYLEAASLIVFINDGSIKNVFEVLQNHRIRHNFIDRIPINQKENLSEYIDYLIELDDVDRRSGEIIGTRYHCIEGIIDRLNVLKRNTYIELMLKKDCQENFNLYNEIQKPQLICIRMPECMFSTAQEKDIFCTYWFSKLWLTLQLRKNDIERDKHIKVNILVDELYQVERCQSLISSKLSQMPKFTAKLIVSCHYLNQISELREELRACNSSYMLLQGSNVSNYDSLHCELDNLNFSTDDLLNLKRYHSLNLLSYENGYWAGITALPKPLKSNK